MLRICGTRFNKEDTSSFNVVEYVKEKKPQKVARAETKAPQLHELKRRAAAALVELIKDVRPIGSGSAVKAPVVFKAPPSVVKSTTQPVEGRAAPIKTRQIETISNAPERSSHVAVKETNVSKLATPVKSRAKEIFPVFSAWPEHPTKADVESVAKHFARRSEGYID